jgi:synaptojanin
VQLPFVRIPFPSQPFTNVLGLDFAQTRLCFVTAHLAAGFANYDERNRDYATIAHGLRFPRGRGLSDHDAVVWLGDFNYRIGLSNEKVRPVAFDASQWPSLFRHDQLNLQMVAGHAFPYFREAPIQFAPTYRYDVGTDTYDSSEKQRIPAWTDRVLWRGEIVKSLAYGAAPVRCSDHRPVFGLFRVQVSVEDEKKKAVLQKEIDREVVARGVGGAEERKSDEDVDLLGDSPREAEGGRWWLSNGAALPK